MALYKNTSTTRILLDKRPTSMSRYSCEAMGSVMPNGKPRDWMDIDAGDEKLPMIAAAIASKILVPMDAMAMPKKEAPKAEPKMEAKAEPKAAPREEPKVESKASDKKTHKKK